MLGDARNSLWDPKLLLLKGSKEGVLMLKKEGFVFLTAAIPEECKALEQQTSLVLGQQNEPAEKCFLPVTGEYATTSQQHMPST